MHPVKEAVLAETRRQFFGKVAMGVGGLALSSLMAEDAFGLPQDDAAFGGLPSLPHFAPKAKRCIYLHMMGAPPQMDLLDYKPGMRDWYDRDLPESIRQGQRLTTMTSGQTRFPIAPVRVRVPAARAERRVDLRVAALHGAAWRTRSPSSARCTPMPSTTSRASRSSRPDQQIPGRPCIGAWFAYGLGSMNRGPADVRGDERREEPPEVGRAGDLGEAVERRVPVASSTPVSGCAPGPTRCCTCATPTACRATFAGGMLDGLADLNRIQHERIGESRDPRPHPAVRDGVPHAVVGAGDGRPVERAGADLRALGRGGEAARQVPERCVDGAAAGRAGGALRPDLPPGLGRARVRARGAAGAGEGRGPRGVGAHPGPEGARALRRDARHLGRRVRPHDLLAGPADADRLRARPPSALLQPVDGGGGVKGGVVHGETDDFSYNIVRDPVHIRDFQATLLHLFGIDHERFTHNDRGLDARLTGVEPARVVRDVLA